MLKVVSPDAWDWGEPVAALVKASRRGLRGNDLSVFVKRAGHEMASYLDEMRPGETPVHLIALGSTEYYGPNRNGDGFKEAANRRKHATFVTKARVYRNHANKNPAKSYGRVVKSAYHDAMHRVELLIGLNETKEAAERNGGLVADQEHALIEKGAALPWSMACVVPFDICDACNNQAAHRGEYCDDVAVKLASGRVIPACPRGGVRHNMCKVSADGYINHVDNTEPDYFDISRVTRPADRIAYAFGVLQKAATAGVVKSGAELAEDYGIEAPFDLFADATTSRRVLGLMKLARELADVERAQDTPRTIDLALDYTTCAPVSTPPELTKRAWRALADEAIVLPLSEWLAVATGNREKAAEAYDDVASCLPGVYGRIVRDPEAPGLLASTAYDASREEPTGALRFWAAKHASDYALDASRARRRVLLSSVRGGAYRDMRPTVKEASDSPGAELVARQYALYQLAALDAVRAAGRDEDRAITILALRGNVLA